MKKIEFFVNLAPQSRPGASLALLAMRIKKTRRLKDIECGLDYSIFMPTCEVSIAP